MRTLLLMALVACAAPASAQMLPSGTWTGTLDRDGVRTDVEAVIERCDTGFRVVLDMGGRTAGTETAEWAGGRLRFAIPRVRLPGTFLARTLTCDLRADDSGALGGSCANDSATVRLHLRPPADGSFGCDD